MSKENSNGKSRFLWALVVMLLLAIVYLVFRNVSNTKGAKINEDQEVELAEIEQRLTQFKGNWNKEIETLKNTESTLEKNSESFRLTQLLITTFNSFLIEVEDLNQRLPNIKDTLSYQFALNEIDDIERGWQGSKQLINEHRKLLNTFNLMSTYQSRIDSIKGVLADDKIRLGLSSNQLEKLKNEIKQYEEKIDKLKTKGAVIQFENDSLKAVSKAQASQIDSLTKALENQRAAYDELVDQAKKNAVFATRLSLWYFEKDNKSKPRRRQLTSKKEDFNKASELKVIYGEFTIDAEKYEPFKVATVYLNNATDEIASVQVSVRDQASGEFVLLPDAKLQKGEYEVAVKYTGETILTQKFYVSK